MGTGVFFFIIINQERKGATVEYGIYDKDLRASYYGQVVKFTTPTEGVVMEDPNNPQYVGMEITGIPEGYYREIVYKENQK